MIYNKNKVIPIDNETGEFLLSPYGSGLALGFKGDSAFLERCLNFVHNFGLSKNTKLSSLGQNCIHYVCTTQERLRNSLIEYFTGQIVLNNLVKPNGKETVEDIDFPIRDEMDVRTCAEAMADKFITEKIIRMPFMSGIENRGFAEFSVSS